MKKLSLLMFALFSTLLCSAQYVPTTQWPYLFENFTQGTIYYSNGTKGKAILNLHLLNGDLHFLQGNNILKTNGTDVVRVEIGDQSFLYVNNQLMEIIDHNGNNVLLKSVLADFDALLSSTGAYGADANTHSRRDLSSLGISIGGVDITDHGLMQQNKKEGKELNEKVSYYLIINNQTFEANKKEVQKNMPADKTAAWKKFLKENKIKWKDEESLSKVLHFFN